MKRLSDAILKNFVYLMLVGSGGILAFMLINLSTTVDHLSQSMIQRSIDRTKVELDGFFSPVISNIKIAQERGQTGTYDTLNFNQLNRLFMPMVNNTPQVSSMLIGDTDGNEYMLLNLGEDIWRNRLTINGSAEKRSTELKWWYNGPGTDSLMQVWEKDKDYDPRSRPWFQGAIENQSITDPHWTDPYTFFTTKDPGITVAYKWQSTNTTKVIAFDLLLTDISRFTTAMDVSENGKAFVLTSDLKVLGLPKEKKYSNLDALKKDVLSEVGKLKNKALIDAVRTWKKQDKKEKYFSFVSGDVDWWGSIQTYELGSDRTLLIGVVVPATDFVGEVQKTRNIIIAGFFIILVFGVIISRAYAQKKKSNLLIEEKNRDLKGANQEITYQKEEIEEKNKEITDSIKYAQRIQEAILPPTKLVKTYLQESFVLFKPKDIVSGDFYWLETVDDHVLFSAVDCTGHGVPGAMVSVVGHNGLNRCVKEFGITQPSKILDKLTDLVEETFEKSESEVKDGMDMAICSLNFQTNELQYAGANNPLWIITKNSERHAEFIEVVNGSIFRLTQDAPLAILEIKANKQPIGKYDDHQPFVNHTIQLQKGDIIYIFSDGYADQFGGSKGKKFKYKQFKEILLSIQDKSMVEQRKLLDETIEEWRGELEQIDDIVIIGVRI
jgi:serine phosphatase RsbU (regulator of sigma subunit)